MVKGLTRHGYALDHQSRGEILGGHEIGRVAVCYLDVTRQTKHAMDYTVVDILTDRPSKLTVIDMGTGEVSMLELIDRYG